MGTQAGKPPCLLEKSSLLLPGYMILHCLSLDPKSRSTLEHSIFRREGTVVRWRFCASLESVLCVCVLCLLCVCVHREMKNE